MNFYSINNVILFWGKIDGFILSIMVIFGGRGVRWISILINVNFLEGKKLMDLYSINNVNHLKFNHTTVMLSYFHNSYGFDFSLYLTRMNKNS